METGQVNERFHAEKEMVMETLFVIGAGTMGGGIAQVAALHGFTVYLYDIKQEFLDRGLKGIAGAWDRLVACGKMAAEDRDAALPRIIGTLDMRDAAKADVVIEAAVEDLDVKRSIFSKLSGIVSPGCILATNTSSLSVTAVASAVGRPDKVVGLHFFNPVPRMALIEIIRGAATSDETYEAAKALSERLGKTAVTVNEYPGFVVNRILIPMINEAVFMLQEGVASAEDIDTAMKLGANHPMGPLALADLIGLDVCLAIMELLRDEMGEGKYRPAPLLRKMVRAGKLGRKSGEGFFRY
ncbi:MAG: 3-hydroxybutyryl-CoA dehydrogenase [Bilophila wadsworthia]|jgi:3-hydroxybutyryl-CoA dehydrogenase|nr:3-hydroxybutyryl-CoA dehydrogenase [Bilophila wadsworthia]